MHLREKTLLFRRKSNRSCCLGWWDTMSQRILAMARVVAMGQALQGGAGGFCPLEVAAPEALEASVV